MYIHTYTYFYHSFDNFDIHSTHRPFVDVWPSCVRFNEEFDNTFTLLLQLACVLHMKGGWKTHWKIRIFLIIETDSKQECGNS